MIRYLSGVSNEAVRAIAHEHSIGLLVTPDTGYVSQVDQFPFFAADNGMYGLAKRHQEDKFDAEKFFSWVKKLPRSALFVAVPDVLHFVEVAPGKEVPVGDAVATLAQFPVYARRLREMGFKTGLVGQDGMESMIADIPWGLVDVVFLGGSTEWKLGGGGRRLVAEAKARGLSAHMGRVNSRKRLKYAESIGCDTADGTFLAYAGRDGAKKGVAKMLKWFDKEEQCEFIWPDQ